jgi:hypothetical protein
MMLDLSWPGLNVARALTRNAIGGEKGSVVEAEIPGREWKSDCRKGRVVKTNRESIAYGN